MNGRSKFWQALKASVTEPKPDFHTPPSTSAIGMWLLLAALFMLFAAGLLGYVMIRFSKTEQVPLGSIHIPQTLWYSTALVAVGSIVIQYSVHQLRRERQSAFRRSLVLSMFLAIAFVIVQTPAMVQLMAQQHQVKEKNIALYALIFFLVLLHALHVLGGIVSMAWATVRATMGKYDHEHYQPVARVALYWHFLDLVWLSMFFTFLLVK